MPSAYRAMLWATSSNHLPAAFHAQDVVADAPKQGGVVGAKLPQSLVLLLAVLYVSMLIGQRIEVSTTFILSVESIGRGKSG